MSQANHHRPARTPALLVSPREAAAMLAVSERKLWSMTFEADERLPYVRCGRLVRYAVDDLCHWIESNKTQKVCAD